MKVQPGTAVFVFQFARTIFTDFSATKRSLPSSEKLMPYMPETPETPKVEPDALVAKS